MRGMLMSEMMDGGLLLLLGALRCSGDVNR